MVQLPLFQPEPPATPDKLNQMLGNSNCRILVAFSGGKDSVAMVLDLLDRGIPKDRIELHHHEVDGRGGLFFDWGCTTSYCEAFAKAFELPIVFSWRAGGIRREMRRTNEGLQPVVYERKGEEVLLPSRPGNSTRRKFPAVSADLRTRWCSSVAKIDVLSRVVNAEYKEGELLILTGERRQESAARAKYQLFEPYRSRTQKRDAWQWRSVLDHSERQVWALLRKYKVQPHPAYELGWGRCSCQLCIFSSANTWASLYELSPEKVQGIASLEQELGHTLYHGCTIMDKVRAGRSMLKPNLVARWGREALTAFQSPIFVEDWQLPAGAFATERAGAV